LSAIVPVILSGGAGTRLWPLSTDQMPKQFLRTWGDGRSLFEQSLARVTGDGFLPPVVVCNRSQEALVRADAERAGLVLGVVLLEPDRRDSAAAIAAAAAWVGAEHGEDAVIAVFPSDQLIPDTGAFQSKLRRASEIAAAGFIVTFGIKPTRAATEFGYIQRGTSLAPEGDAFQVTAFREKPAPPVAEAYFASGQHSWNSGMFVFQAATFGDEAGQHMPDVHRAATAAVMDGRHRDRAVDLDPAAFGSAPRISIDYALLEKSSRVAVLPVDFAWSDVGNWQSAYESLGPDPEGNVIRGGDVRVVDSRSCLVVSETIPVRVLGLEGVSVIVTSDGVLVTPLARAADVKQVL